MKKIITALLLTAGTIVMTANAFGGDFCSSSEIDYYICGSGYVCKDYICIPRSCDMGAIDGDECWQHDYVFSYCDGGVCKGYGTPICQGSCPGTGWVSNGTGKEKMTGPGVWNTSNCSCSAGVISYRCANNYYGNGITCTACPCMQDKDGINRCGTNVAGSNTTITSCEMGSMYTFNDGPGTYKFTFNCAYTQ